MATLGRNGVVAAALTCVWLAALSAPAAPAIVQDPLEALAAKIGKTKSVHVKFTYSSMSRGAETQRGEFDVWFDKPGKRYLALDKYQNTGRANEYTSGVLVNGKHATVWYAQDRNVQNAYRYPAENYIPTDTSLPMGNYARACVLDALSGYKNVGRVFSLKPAKSPLPEHDKLRWFDAQLNAGTPEHKNFRQRSENAYRMQFGFDPQTGWLKVIVTESGANWKSVTTVTSIEEDPDTKNVFALPKEVRDVPLMDPKTGQPVPADER